MERRSVLGWASAGLLGWGLQGAPGMAQAAPAAAGLTAIHPWLGEGEQLQAELLVDGVSLGQFTHKAAGLQRAPALSLALPANAKQLALRGSWQSAKGTTRSVAGNWQLLDLAGLTRPLYDPALDMAARITQFCDAAQRALSQRGSKASLDELSVAPAVPGAAEKLAAREKQWQLRLPAAVHQLMRLKVELGDSHYLAAGELQTVGSLLKEWGGSLQDFAPATRARYERSVAVFVEVGDGMGCIAWDPQGVRAGEPSGLMVDERGSAKVQAAANNEGVWFSVHQEMVAKPELFLNSQLQPVGAVQALLNPIQTLLLDQLLADWAPASAKGPLLPVDSANPLFHVQLSVDERGKPTLRQRSYEDHSPLARLWL